MAQKTLAFAVLIVAASASHLGASPQYLPPNQNFGGGSSGAGQTPITRFDNDNNGEGNYNYHYETGNGISVQEQGSLKNAGSQNEALTAQGSYSYTAPDGQKITVTYTADENGFHPQGAHLPTPPPIPDAILKSIEQNRAEEARGGYKGDNGGYNY